MHGRADLKISSFERQEKIAEFIVQQKRATIAQICTNFEVSLATARRDLEVLADRGRVQRVHGGAVSLHLALPEAPVFQRKTEQSDEKKRIGAAAAALIQDGECVFIGSGTTALEAALNLRARHNLTVVTNSLLVMDALAGATGIMLVMLGGILRPSEMSVIGHITELGLAELRVDKVILGIRAIDASHGLTSDYLPETMTDRAILSIGREIIVVADHTKLGFVSTAFVAPLSAIHVLITDQGAPENYVTVLVSQGIRVISV